MNEIAEDRTTPVAATGGLTARLARRIVLAGLARLRHGSIELIEGGRRRRFGPGDDAELAPVTLHVDDVGFYRRVLLGGSCGMGESYMQGGWRCDDLTTLLRTLARNREVWYRVEEGWARFTLPARKLGHWLNRNTRRRSRDNVAAHYDLGNPLFELFLDPTMMYSCGVFEHADDSMEAASVEKNDRICRKLGLGPDDHVLEIGTGWGGFALHAVQRYGCRVTTTTLSNEQYAHAAERFRAAGVADRITLLRKDYRDLDGRYDKLVSIEMIEAVGHEYYETFFRQCGELLAPGGLALLQAITIEDAEYETSRRSVDFIKRYIFPGGSLPSVAAMTATLARATRLQLVGLEDIGYHYALTLRRWRDRFEANRQLLRERGYDERFMRCWRFYFAYCEAGFLERTISDVHLLLAAPACREWPGRKPHGTLAQERG